MHFSLILLVALVSYCSCSSASPKAPFRDDRAAPSGAGPKDFGAARDNRGLLSMLREKRGLLGALLGGGAKKDADKEKRSVGPQPPMGMSRDNRGLLGSLLGGSREKRALGPQGAAAQREMRGMLSKLLKREKRMPGPAAAIPSAALPSQS